MISFVRDYRDQKANLYIPTRYGSVSSAEQMVIMGTQIGGLDGCVVVVWFEARELNRLTETPAGFNCNTKNISYVRIRNDNYHLPL